MLLPQSVARFLLPARLPLSPSAGGPVQHWQGSVCGEHRLPLRHGGGGPRGEVLEVHDHLQETPQCASVQGELLWNLLWHLLRALLLHRRRLPHVLNVPEGSWASQVSIQGTLHLHLQQGRIWTKPVQLSSQLPGLLHQPPPAPVGWGGNPQKMPSCRDWSLNTDTNCGNLFSRPPKPDALGIFLNL